MSDPLSKTVKGMDPVVWGKGVKDAQRRGQPFAEWLAEAISDRLDKTAGDRVILPDEREPVLPRSAPPVAQHSGVAFALPEIEAAMRTAAIMAEAAGLEVPKPMARHYFGLLNETLRMARGLKPAKRRQTRRPEGQTHVAIEKTVIEG